MSKLIKEADPIEMTEEQRQSILQAFGGGDTAGTSKSFSMGLMTTVTTEDEYHTNPSGAPTQIILADDGWIYQKSEFSMGRHLTRKLGQYGAAKFGRPAADRITEGFQILAHGNKIPKEMFLQVIAFFKRVMRDKIPSSTANRKGYEGAVNMAGSTGSFEAMAHIVWNDTTKEYRVAIPTQTVSAAAVKYNFDHILPGEEIILDIHSHNNMGAFFSGTDNADDRNMISISGVAGKLGTTAEYVWRFNYGQGRNFAITNMSDLFEDATPEDVPDEWMGKVTTPSYASYVHGGNGTYPNYRRNTNLDGSIRNTYPPLHTQSAAVVGADNARFPVGFGDSDYDFEDECLDMMCGGNSAKKLNAAASVHVQSPSQSLNQDQNLDQEDTAIEDDEPFQGELTLSDLAQDSTVSQAELDNYGLSVGVEEMAALLPTCSTQDREALTKALLSQLITENDGDLSFLDSLGIDYPANNN